MYHRLILPAFAICLASAALAQDEVLQPPPTVAPDALTQARDAVRRGDPAEALSRYLRVLAARPDDVTALIGAGQAALAVGDMNAAAGFLARADALSPRNGEVKAGLARTVLQRGDARAALRLFNEAEDLGVPPLSFAADRGLARDLRGDQRRAQADYQLVLRAAPNDEVTRRLAISQAIAGDRAAALATLDPLLRRQDVPAWRARAFVFALTGDNQEAIAGAALVMPRDQAAALAPYLPRLAALKPAEKAAAIHLGQFPGETAPPPRAAAVAAPRLPFDQSALAAPTPDPFAPYVPPASGDAVADDHARAKALADVLADARARAAARARVPEAIRAGGRMIPEPIAPPTRRQTRAEAAREAKADKEQARTNAAEKKAASREPARHWVQVAGGADKAALGKAWAALKAKYPKQLAGRSPWTSHYRFTNRLLVGPFSTSDAAQDWADERRKEGLGAFRVETAAGDPVGRVKG